MSVSYPCSYLYCSPSSNSESSSESEKQSRLYFKFSLSISCFPLLFSLGLIWVPVSQVQSFRSSCLGLLLFWLEWCLLDFVLFLLLFFVLTEGAIWSPSALFCRLFIYFGFFLFCKGLGLLILVAFLCSCLCLFSLSK